MQIFFLCIRKTYLEELFDLYLSKGLMEKRSGERSKGADMEYERPSLVDLAAGRSVGQSACHDGPTAAAVCQSGGAPGGQCRTGGTAGGNCVSGYGPGTGACRNGHGPGGECSSGAARDATSALSRDSVRPGTACTLGLLPKF